MDATIGLADPGPTVIERRPRFEGSNIGTWIGFKHVMYLVEEAVIQYLRDHGVQPGRLFEQHALGLEIVDSSIRLVQALDMDDVGRLRTRSLTRAGDREMTFQVEIFVTRGGVDQKAASGQVKVVFRRAPGDANGPVADPEAVAAYVTPEIRRSPSGQTAREEVVFEPGTVDSTEDAIRQVIPREPHSFVWKWHVPYFYCHFTERLQHSGYVRLMEEVVDLFLRDRGISIGGMLQSRGWIPVVSSARLEVLREALMEDAIYTVFTVEDIIKGLSYTARMDCYVPRHGRLVHTAAGRITHAYLHIESRGTAGALAPFDDAVMAALTGERR